MVRKEKMAKPIDPLPERELCQYEEKEKISSRKVKKLWLDTISSRI